MPSSVAATISATVAVSISVAFGRFSKTKKVDVRLKLKGRFKPFAEARGPAHTSRVAARTDAAWRGDGMMCSGEWKSAYVCGIRVWGSTEIPTLNLFLGNSTASA
mmetsp:Transcript_22421/g.43629  ORF Transcript_22421/g.43629 Transcript_22421/m.43629 type:complete len:105 (-) Transcript_22421:48-362(-)